MKKTKTRFISLLLTLAMILSMLPATVFAGTSVSVTNDGTTVQYKVEIVSFNRGVDTDLRTSELLEARIYQSTDSGSTWTEATHVNGVAVSNLTYKWQNGSTGLTLCTFNTHDMSSLGTSNQAFDGITVNSGKTSTAAVGYRWAALKKSSSANSGSLTVTVSGFGDTAMTDTYTGFAASSLSQDLEHIALGIFEGDSVTILKLLGQAGLVHINCSSCSVSGVLVKSGTDYGTYSNGTITGTSAGDSEGVITLTMDVSKSGCTVHGQNVNDVESEIYVFKKPVAATSATSITLTNIDTRCTYTINGVSKSGSQAENGTLTFEGLDPNTTYDIEVRGDFEDNGVTKHAYAYLTATTTNQYRAIVWVFLDTTSETDAQRVSIADILGEGYKLYLLDKSKTSDYLEMEYVDEVKDGETTVPEYYYRTMDEGDTGTYRIYASKDGVNFEVTDTQDLIMGNQDVRKNLFYYSVNYNAGGGTYDGASTTYHILDSKVVLPETVPTLDGYDFTGWLDDADNDKIADEGEVIYQPGDTLTEEIDHQYNLVAQWEVAARAKVNVKVIIDHQYKVGGVYQGVDQSRTGNLNINLAYKTADSQSEPYVEVVGADYNTVKSDWATKGTITGDRDITIQPYYTTVTYSGIFSGLSVDYDYSATAFLPNYYVVSRDVTESNDTSVGAKQGDKVYDVTINLAYSPDLFELKYDVVFVDKEGEALTAVPEEMEALIPQAVDLKVTSWKNNEWSPISAHSDYSVDVNLNDNDLNTEGSGSYYVPVHQDVTNNTLYYYRVSVAGLTLKDGTELTASPDPSGSVENYSSDVATGYPEGAYTATVVVTGETPVDASAAGASGEESGDSYAMKSGDKIVVKVQVHPYTVSFVDNDENDNTNIASVTNTFKLPDLSAYQPTRDGYTFGGWYTDEKFENKAVSNAYITENTTLYAKWNADLTISGDITVDYFSDIADINETERISSIVVKLQKSTTIDYWENINEVTCALTEATTSDGDVGTAQYSFTGLTNDGNPTDDYRVVIEALDYETTYTNVTAGNTSSNEATAFADNAAVINAKLDYEPTEFDLVYTVDSSLIDPSLRPETVDVVITYDDGETHSVSDWPIITQMVNADNQVVGQAVSLTDSAEGKDDSTYPVWQQASTGTAYQYSLRLYGLDDSAPYYYTVSNPVHYVVNPATGDVTQSNELVLKLIPKTYTVTYDMNGGTYNGSTDTVMEDYTYSEAGYASYGPGAEDGVLTAAPTKTGYVFAGWRSSNTNIANSAAVTYKLNDGTVTGTIGQITIPNNKEYGDVTMIAQWMEDKKGGDDGNGNETGDGIPDAYQVQITFNVVNGTFEGNTTIKKVIANLTDADGNLTTAANGGTATINVPSAKADTGYTKSYWNPALPYAQGSTTNITVNESKTYTLFYEPNTGIVVGYRHYEGENKPHEPKSDTIDTTNNGATVNVDPNGGSWTYGGTTYKNTHTISVAENETRSIYLGNPTQAGYVFLGWDDSTNETNHIYTYTAKWEKDVISEVIDGAGSDGIPDKFQKTVTFEVVNGIWANGDVSDIVDVVTLLDRDGNWSSKSGTATVTVPTNMKAFEGYDQGSGAWGVPNPSETVSGTEPVTYTYTFSGNGNVIVNYSEPDPTPKKDDLVDEAHFITSSGKLLVVDMGEGTLTYENVDYTYAIAVELTSETADAFSVTIPDPTREGYLFAGWELTVSPNNDPNDADYTLEAKWEVDSNGDGIPDKYQKFVTFSIHGGTWPSGNTADVTVAVTLVDAYGQWDAKGTGTINYIPSADKMQPSDGYIRPGAWNDQNLEGVTSLTVTGTEPVTYIYSFIKNDGGDVWYGDDEDDKKELDVNQKILVVPNGGTWTHNGETYEDNQTASFTIENGASINLGKATRDGYVFMGWGVQSGTEYGDATYTWVFTAQWMEDQKGTINDDGTETGDGIPDKFQKTVTFKVVNGTWSNGDKSPISYYVTLLEDNTMSESGSATVTAPTGMIANYGYANGAWDSEPSDGKFTVRNDAEFTYTFEKMSDVTVSYNEDDSKTMEYGSLITVDPNGGTWKYKNATYTYPVTLKIEENTKIDDAVRDGYIFTGWEMTEGTDPVVKVFTAQWDEDKLVGEEDMNDLDTTGDGIADKYQRTVTFIIHGGTWNDGTADNIVKTVTLKNEGVPSENGTATVDVPTGMEPDGEHTSQGSWNVEVSSGKIVVSKDSPDIYIYTFVKEKGADIWYGVDVPATAETDDQILVDPAGGTWNGSMEKQSITIKNGDSLNLGEATQDGYVFMGWEPEANKTVDDATYTWVFTAQWDEDTNKDGIADKYQAEVTFKVVNGTWSSYSVEDMVLLVNLVDASGNYSAGGSATVVVPTGMISDYGYTDGSWDMTQTDELTITKAEDGEVYTYTFTKLPDVDLTYNDGTETKTEPVDFGTLVTVNPNGGIWSYDDVTYAYPVTLKIEENTEIEDAVRDGYIFSGWEKIEGTDPVDYVLNAQWTEEVDEGPADPGDTGVSDWLDTGDHSLYIQGYPDGTVRPNRNMTRAEAAQMFYRLLLDQNVQITKSFTDVADDAWYAEAVGSLASIGIISGYPDGTFGPNNNITRAEFTAMAMRFAKESSGEAVFSDVTADHWAYDYIASAAHYGWINGYVDKTFRPDKEITRAEVVTIVNHMLGRVCDEGYALSNWSSMKQFSDLQNNYEWFFFDMVEATNTHEYEKAVNQDESWTGLK